MFDLNLYEAFDELDKLYESKSTTVYQAPAPDISSTRSIDTDKEAIKLASFLLYNNIVKGL